MAGKTETYDLIFKGTDQVSPDIEKIVKSLDGLDDEAKKSEKSTSELAKALAELNKPITGLDVIKGGFSGISGAANVAATAVAASTAAIAAGVTAIGVAAVKAGAEFDAAASRMAAAVGAPEGKAEDFEKVIENVFGKGVVGSIEEAAEAARLAFSRFGDVGVDELSAITDASIKLANLYGSDVNEVVAASSTLMKNFGLSSDEAFDFIAAGFQKGLDGSGDFLDSINEYSTQFKAGGASADQFFSLLQTGFQEGVLGTDKAADAFKEFRLRVNDETKATAEALQALGFDSDKYFADLRSGTKTTADAFQEVIGAVQKIGDPVQKQTLLVGLLGTQFEDLGTQAFEAINLAATKLDDLKGSLEKTSKAFEDITTS